MAYKPSNVIKTNSKLIYPLEFLSNPVSYVDHKSLNFYEILMKLAFFSALALSAASMVFAAEVAKTEQNQSSTKESKAKPATKSKKAEKVSKTSSNSDFKVLTGEELQGIALIQSNLMASRLERLMVGFREFSYDIVMRDLSGKTPSNEIPETVEYASGDINSAGGGNIECVVNSKTISASSDPKNLSKDVSKDKVINSIIDALKNNPEQKVVVTFSEMLPDPADEKKKVPATMIATAWGKKALNPKTDKSMFCYIKAIKQNPQTGS